MTTLFNPYHDVINGVELFAPLIAWAWNICQEILEEDSWVTLDDVTDYAMDEMNVEAATIQNLLTQATKEGYLWKRSTKGTCPSYRMTGKRKPA